jgi:hypothetical protein
VATIKLDCLYCGEVALPPENLEILDVARTRVFYRYRCNFCEEIFFTTCKEEHLDDLVAAGVSQSFPPEEVFEPHFGPPFDLNDVIDFHFFLLALDKSLSAAPIT